jgi:two-component system response regulator
MTGSQTSFKILLVEDNPADAHLVERALRKSRFTPHLTVVEDGIEALDFLRPGETTRTPAVPISFCWI